MNICIDKCKIWLDQHRAVKQWLWFVALWFGGLITVATLTYPLKLLTKLL